MSVQKIYAGVSLRETRARAGLNQRAFAERLGVSLPYLSQMENNHRPISAGVLLRLAQEFGIDLTALSAGDAERLVIDMQEALADPVFDAAPALADLRLAATNAPVLARAFLDLYRAHRSGQERLAALIAPLAGATLLVSDAPSVEEALLEPLDAFNDTTDHLVQLRLDDDDGISVNFIARLRENARKMAGFKTYAISQCRGLTLHNWDGAPRALRMTHLPFVGIGTAARMPRGRSRLRRSTARTRARSASRAGGRPGSAPRPASVAARRPHATSAADRAQGGRGSCRPRGPP